MQVYTIHQRCKESRGAPCISEWFGPGEWVNLNSSYVWLNLWYLKGLELRLACGESKWSLKGNMMNLRGKVMRHQERRSAWCGVRGGQGECWWWSSEEWNWGAQIEAKERRRGLRSTYPAEQPIQAEQGQKGREVKSLEWNGGAPNRGWGVDVGAPILEEECRQKRQYGALNETSKHQSRLRSAYYSGGAPFWGGMKQPSRCNWWV